MVDRSCPSPLTICKKRVPGAGKAQVVQGPSRSTNPIGAPGIEGDDVHRRVHSTEQHLWTFEAGDEQGAPLFFHQRTGPIPH